jgi:hypothetical protein
MDPNSKIGNSITKIQGKLHQFSKLRLNFHCAILIIHYTYFFGKFVKNALWLSIWSQLLWHLFLPFLEIVSNINDFTQNLSMSERHFFLNLYVATFFTVLCIENVVFVSLNILNIQESFRKKFHQYFYMRFFINSYPYLFYLLILSFLSPTPL